jgi:aminopeptidase N
MSARYAVLLLAALAFTTTTAVEAQRLPSGVRPQAYKLTLTPDLKAATFTGSETIDIVLDEPSKTVTLNAADIQFGEVKAYVPAVVAASPSGGPGSQPVSPASGETDGHSQIATTTLDEAKEQATFSFPKELPAGRITLTVQYTGILNDKLRGFYLSKTKTRNYAVTQFEPTDARRAYPSFDEPALKATYDITLVVDTNDTAISNTNLISDKPGPTAGKHTVHFATTPKMSTYLVAFLVGDFKCSEGKSDGVPIRACATPDKVELTKFAVESAKYVLHYYDTYFGIKYPMPKLDMVALPDFEAGAMENFGCITYRETDLLIDSKTGSVPAKKRVAEVVAHEMAHQWFGDMVTMQWWDNIWLNEGFATWMEMKPITQWHPEWNFPQDVAQDLDNTLNLDAQKTTHTIRATADTPAQINEMFDGISYGKGGAVLGMVENYLGEEIFRQGVHNYLQAHMYANATAEDFWNAQTSTSHLPVDKIMSSFITKPGVPLLTLSERQAAGVPVSESRFFLTPLGSQSTSKMEDVKEGWTIPICVKTNGKPICRALTPEDSRLSLPTDVGLPFLYANAVGKGYYRTAYTPEQFNAIVAKAETALTAPERIGLLGDRFALVRSGQGTVGDYLNLVLALREDPDATVLDSVYRRLLKINSDIATDEDRIQLAAVLRRQFGPVYAALGEPEKNESYDRQQLRGILFELLGAAKDPAVLAQARQLTDRVYIPGGKVDKTLNSTLADAAVLLTTMNGDAVLYDKILIVSKDPSDPGQQADALHLLARFGDPALVTRTLDYAVSGQVRNQDSWTVLAALLANRETRDQAWAYIQKNWDKVHAQFTTDSGVRVVAATGFFCNAEQRDDVVSFFATHKVDASQRTLAKAVDSMNDCIQLRDSQEPNLHQWLELRPK